VSSSEPRKSKNTCIKADLGPNRQYLHGAWHNFVIDGQGETQWEARQNLSLRAAKYTWGQCGVVAAAKDHQMVPCLGFTPTEYGGILNASNHLNATPRGSIKGYNTNPASITPQSR